MDNPQEKTEVQKVETAELEALPITPGMVFVATNPQELLKAQAQLVGWADHRFSEVEKTVKELEENVAIAAKNKWRTSTLKNMLARAKKEVVFYKKVKAALEAGYYLIPNFPVDVFAIRTEKRKPRSNESTGSLWGVGTQKTTSPPAGTGKFVDSEAQVLTDTWTENEDGKKVEKHRHYSDTFKDVDFPFALARPEIMTATAKALGLRIFDEIGASPSRSGHAGRPLTKGDPMIIGRVVTRQGYHEKALSFLISWFVDTKDL